MVGRCIGLHPKSIGRLSKGTQKQKQSVELQALRLLRTSTKESVAPAVYSFLSSLGIAATEAPTSYTLFGGVYEKAQRDGKGMERLSKLKGV